MVIQVVMTSVVKILIVQGEHLLGKCELEESYICQECYISPDTAHILLQLSRYDPDGRTRKINVCQLRDGQLLCRYHIEIPTPLHLRLERLGPTACIAFGPHVPHGQISIFQSDMFQTNCRVMVYDLCCGCQIESWKEFTIPYILSAQYSPDGSMIAAVCEPLRSVEFAQPREHSGSIIILCSSSYEVMHTIDIYYSCSSHWFIPLRMFPAFSYSGQHLATVDDFDNPHYVRIHQMPLNSPTLKDYCRQVIRQYTRKHYLHLLPLPKELLQFVQFFQAPSPMVGAGGEDHTCPCFGGGLPNGCHRHH